MVSVLVDDWLYVNIDGNVGIYGYQEAQRIFQSKIKIVNVAFLEYQTKVVPLNHEHKNLDSQINAVFDKDYSIVQEKISTEALQVIAAKKEKIEEIYRYFQGVQVASLVPYAVSIRAILKDKGLLDVHKRIIFVDDLNNQPVVTFFDDMRFSSPRRVDMSNSEYAISDIKRSLQNFISEGSDKQHSLNTFVLISNNKQWQADFVSRNFIPREHVIHFDIQFPVLQGLKEAKFKLHFALIEQIVKQKKLKIWKSRIKTIAVATMFVLLGIGPYLTMSFFKNKKKINFQSMANQIDREDDSLRMLYQRKFMNYLKQNDSLDYRRIYFDFVRAIPEGQLIDSLKFKKQAAGNWSFQAIIYPKDENTFLTDFRRELFYPDSKISFVITRKVLGQQIVASLATEESEL